MCNMTVIGPENFEICSENEVCVKTSKYMVPTLFQIQNSRTFQGLLNIFQGPFFVKNIHFGVFITLFIKFYTTRISEITIL